MRILILLSVTFIFIQTARAAIFNYGNNPFPHQNCPELNNIYETESTVEQKEKESANKVKKSWFNKKNTGYNDCGVNEGIIQGSPDGSFYVFPASK